MKQGSVTFVGKSGERYHFQVWSLDARFKSVAAVYYVTKRAYDSGTYRRACHDGIFIGQTEDLSGALAPAARPACFSKHGANCVCVYLQPDEARRIAVEQDLLAAHSTHCNHQTRAARIFDLAEALSETGESVSALARAGQKKNTNVKVSSTGLSVGSKSDAEEQAPEPIGQEASGEGSQTGEEAEKPENQGMKTEGEKQKAEGLS